MNIKIIKHGNRWHRYECKTCGCIFCDVENFATLATNGKVTDSAGCPECGAITAADPEDKGEE